MFQATHHSSSGAPIL